jgi:transcriptional regulator with XRE-family HTH domain
MGKEVYHHGAIIREYRIKKGLTQSQLADVWPGKNNKGVSNSYIQGVEYGHKHIEDMQTLYKVCDILDIPYWKVGLSDINPFDTLEQNEKDNLFSLNIEALQAVIEQTWRCKLIEPLPIVQNYVLLLSKQSSFIKNNYPERYVTNRGFLHVYAQNERLHAIVYSENKQFKLELEKNYDMLDTAKELNEASTLALAYARLGVALLRNDKILDSIDALETARDYTFRTSNNLAALVNAFLARAYATYGDMKRFERSIDTAIRLSESMGDVDIDITDSVFHSRSGIIEEKSNGYILLKQSKKALSVLPAIESQVARENNHYLRTWLPLEWAQVLFLSGEAEESLQRLKEYVQFATSYQSPRMLSHVNSHLSFMRNQGYDNETRLNDFSEEIRDMLTVRQL